MSKTRVPAIPAPTDSNLREVARAVKGVLDVREGLIGDPLDANVTFRELVDGGVIQVTSTGNRVTSVTSTGSGSSSGYDPTTDLTPPPAPTEFTATGLFASVQLQWAAPPDTYANHAYTEIWRAAPTFTNATPPIEVAPVIGNAVLIGTTDARIYVDYLGNNVPRYYWIRFVSQADVKGPYNGTSGTRAETAQSPSLLLNSLTAAITAGELATSLGDRVNLIDAPTTGLTSKYTIKVDSAGHVSGFGLATTANVAESPFSEFGVRANRFWIAPPAVSSATAPSTNLYKGYVWRDTSSNPAVTRYWSGTAWTTTPQALPFVVQTSATTVNGVSVPPGVYIDDVFIENGTITNAKIGNAAIDDAKIANLSAAKITAGTLDVARLGANSITADRIRVTGKGGLTIISDDPLFGDPTLWTITTNVSYGSGDSTPGGKGGTYVASSTGTDGQITSARRYDIDPTRVYRLSANLYRDASSDRNVYIFVQFYNGAGTYLGGTTWGGSKSGYVFSGVPSPDNLYVRCGNSFGLGTPRPIPSTARYCEIGVWFNVGGTGTTTSMQRCQDLRLDEYINGGELIVDGSVTANQINSNGLSIRDTAGNVILSAGSSVAASNFLGNVTGNVNGVAAATVQANAANGASAWGKFSGAGGTLPAGNVEFNFAGSGSKGGNATNTDNVGSQTAAVVASAASNFNTRNDRKNTTPAVPTVLTDGTAVDHVVNTDGAADVSFEWGFTGIGDAYDIDGFLVYVRQGATNAVYTFGTTPAEEVVYTVASDRRAFILYGVPADKFYTFGVRAYRIVDQDVSASGILLSAIVKATGTGENPYQPSASVAFGGNVSGTVNGVAGSTLTTAATNFNGRNDRISTAVVAPVLANATGTLDHVINTDGSADISVEWTWDGTESEIDGFIVFVHDNGITTPTAQRVITGAANASEMVFYVTAQRRAFILTGAAADHWYTFGVRAYRIVDPDINSSGVLNSAVVQPLTNASETTFGAYRPSANVAFSGNVTGTINGDAAATVATGAANGTSALNAINDGTTGLATKLSSNARTALTGSGGVAVGSLQWNTSGVRTSGFGIGLTSNGLAAYNSSGAATFSILASDGSATFAGALSAATGSFTGAVYGGSYTSSFAWPSAGTPSAPNNGFHLSSGGLMLGNYNTLYGTAPNQYRKFFLVEANGDVQAPGFTIINGTATFSGTVSANVINTEAIIGGAASTGAVTTTTAASASITITVPTGASAVLIQYYLGPDTVTYTGGSGKDGGGSYTYGPILTGLTATPAGGSPSTTSVIIVGPTAGTYTITATRSYYTGTMRLGAVVLKR